MQVNVLLQGYVSDCIPECNLVSFVLGAGQVGQNVGLEASAAEVNSLFNIVVSYIDSEGTWFLQVQFAIADACVPSGIVVVSCGVLPVFTEYAEVGNRNNEVSANQFIASKISCVLFAYSFDVVNADVSNVQVECAASVECISVSNCCSVIRGIEAAIASGQVYFVACMDCCFSAIYAVGIAIQPAALVTESDRNTAEANGCSFAKVMVCKQLIKLYIRTIFTPWLRYGSTSIAKNTRLRKISPAAQTGRIALPIVFSRSCFPDACWYPACAATGRGGVC